MFDPDVGTAEVVSVRIGTTAQTQIHRVDRGDVVSSKYKVKDVDVLGNSLRAKRLRNGHEPVIHVPTKHHLCRGLALFRSKFGNGRVRKRVGRVARGAGASNAAAERRP